MKADIKSVFNSCGIEYFSPRDYSELRVINPHLEARLGFVPRSAFIFLVPYYTGDGENVSSYAVSVDYHAAIKVMGEKLCQGLSALFPEAHFSCSADHCPIDERHAALTSHLGILGKHGLLINERYGTYVFVAEILTDLDPCRIYASCGGDIGHCCACGRCAVACPTGILRGESESCLSAITQRKGELTESEIALMRKIGTAWGCDVCQRVCPHNAAPALTPIPIFYENRLTRVSVSDIEAMTDEEFSARAFAWRGRAVILRNLRLLDGEEKI